MKGLLSYATSSVLPLILATWLLPDRVDAGCSIMDNYCNSPMWLYFCNTYTGKMEFKICDESRFVCAWNPSYFVNTDIGAYGCVDKNSIDQTPSSISQSSSNAIVVPSDIPVSESGSASASDYVSASVSASDSASVPGSTDVSASYSASDSGYISASDSVSISASDSASVSASVSDPSIGASVSGSVTDSAASSSITSVDDNSSSANCTETASDESSADSKTDTASCDGHGTVITTDGPDGPETVTLPCDCTATGAPYNWNSTTTGSPTGVPTGVPTDSTDTTAKSGPTIEPYGSQATKNGKMAVILSGIAVIVGLAAIV